VEYLQIHNIDRAYQCLNRMVGLDPGLLGELDVFYELGCGNQPKGQRGDFARLDLPYNAGVLITILGMIFDPERASRELRKYKRLAYGRAYHALGLLSYGAQQLKMARIYFLYSMLYTPTQIFNHSVTSSFAKSLLGEPLLSQLRGLKTSLLRHTPW
jgi:hypothetical protein